MGVLTFICWPCLADCRVYERTTNNRVKSLWLPLTIDGLRAHYGPSDERAYWQVAHRWAEHGRTPGLNTGRTTGCITPATYYWPGKPADWILAAKDRAHGSMIKRPTLVKGQKPSMTINYRVTESLMLTVGGLPGLEIGGGGQSRAVEPRRPSVQPVVVWISA